MNQMPMNEPRNMNGQYPPMGNAPVYPGHPGGNGAPNSGMSGFGPGAGPVPPMPPMPDVNGKKQGNKKKKSGKNGGSSAGWVVLGVFLMFAMIALGVYFGYQSAVNARMSEYDRQKKVAAADQYAMALADINNGKLENAKTRLEYVLSVDNNYPGAQETYQQVVIDLIPVATATPLPTEEPQATATPDTRGEEEMFQGIQYTMASQNWSEALNQMDALRDRNLDFRAVEVDGMYYIALRNDGLALINQGYLEQGVYKITLAESFGPIDGNAESFRLAARSYLAGAGFWEIDWDKALEYYSYASESGLQLFDRATGWTAQERYIKASFAIGDKYVETEDFCGAVPYYAQALSYSGDEFLQATGTAVYVTCHPEVLENPTAADSNTSEQQQGDAIDYTDPNAQIGTEVTEGDTSQGGDNGGNGDEWNQSPEDESYEEFPPEEFY